MAKSDKATVTKRIHEVLKILLAGGEFEDIRQYAAAKAWNISDRQLRRYQEWAYERLAEATNQNQKQLMGRHLMQRRGLYARALKTNDVRTALMVLKDEASLEGLYPPTKIAPTTPDGLYSYGHASGPPLTREERFLRLLAAEAREDKEEQRLLEQVTPELVYPMPDTMMPRQMLNTCALIYVAEQLDRASMLLMGLWRISLGDERASFWEQMIVCHGYRFKLERDGWEQFMTSIGVESHRLLFANHRGSMLELFGDRIYELAPSREEFVKFAAAQGLSQNAIPTAKTLAQGWRDLLNQVLRS